MEILFFSQAASLLLLPRSPRLPCFVFAGLRLLTGLPCVPIRIRSERWINTWSWFSSFSQKKRKFLSFFSRSWSWRGTWRSHEYITGELVTSAHCQWWSSGCINVWLCTDIGLVFFSFQAWCNWPLFGIIIVESWVCCKHCLVHSQCTLHRSVTSSCDTHRLKKQFSRKESLQNEQRWTVNTCCECCKLFFIIRLWSICFNIIAMSRKSMASIAWLWKVSCVCVCVLWAQKHAWIIPIAWVWMWRQSLLFSVCGSEQIHKNDGGWGVTLVTVRSVEQHNVHQLLLQTPNNTQIYRKYLPFYSVSVTRASASFSHTCTDTLLLCSVAYWAVSDRCWSMRRHARVNGLGWPNCMFKYGQN